MACLRGCIITLIAFGFVFPAVHIQMYPQSACIRGCKITGRKEGRKVVHGLCATVLAPSSIADWMKLSGDVGMGPFAHQSIFSSQQYLVTLSSSLNFMGLERSGPHRTLLACFLHYAWNHFHYVKVVGWSQVFSANKMLRISIDIPSMDTPMLWCSKNRTRCPERNEFLIRYKFMWTIMYKYPPPNLINEN